MTGNENCLDVYLGSNKVAHLSLVEDQLVWQYTDVWQQHGFAVSPHLPLFGIIPSVNTTRFLRNMFPEGSAFEELVTSFRLSKANTYGLAQALGLDIPGSLVMVPHASGLPQQSHFRKLSNQELAKRLDHRDVSNLIIWDGKPRLSVAGVQDKINVNLSHDGQLGFSDGTLCSTHILKFEKQNLSHLVLNEYVTMTLASRCKIDVAKVQIRYFNTHPALLVERFDRKRAESGDVFRRHIIDGCQALNLPPHYKYERNFGSGRDVAHIREGASYSKLFDFADQCISPAMTKKKILDWALFNLLIYNHDAHGKNISFFVSLRGLELAPFYDLVNIKMYEEYEQEMAMGMGDEFEPENIHAYQLADFADTCNLPRPLVANRLKQLIKTLTKALAMDFNVELKTTEQLEFLQAYRQEVKQRCAYLLEQAQEITSIVL